MGHKKSILSILNETTTLASKNRKLQGDPEAADKLFLEKVDWLCASFS